MVSKFQIQNIRDLVGPCGTLFGAAILGYILQYVFAKYVLLMVQSLFLLVVFFLVYLKCSFPGYDTPHSWAKPGTDSCHLTLQLLFSHAPLLDPVALSVPYLRRELWGAKKWFHNQWSSQLSEGWAQAVESLGPWSCKCGNVFHETQLPGSLEWPRIAKWPFEPQARTKRYFELPSSCRWPNVWNSCWIAGPCGITNLQTVVHGGWSIWSRSKVHRIGIRTGTTLGKEKPSGSLENSFWKKGTGTSTPPGTPVGNPQNDSIIE